MAHFAKIVDGVVCDIIAINNDVVGEYPESELIGQLFLKSINIDGFWVQTSINNNFRKQYARINGTYDKHRDEFVLEKPNPTWLLDSNNDWQAPV